MITRESGLADRVYSNFLVSVVGNLVGSSSQVIFGEVIWNPLTFLDMIQTADYTPANRAGCFLISACFVYSAICMISSSTSPVNLLTVYYSFFHIREFPSVGLY